MKTRSVSHLSDGALVDKAKAIIARGNDDTAELLVYLAEIDERRLFLPAGHPSMFSFCVHELGLSEDSAYKRITAARAARRFPAIFSAVAKGRLHLTAVVTLSPHLTPENANDLLAAAERKTKSQIEQLLAQRFPRPDVPTRVRAISPPAKSLTLEQLAPERVEKEQTPPVELPAPRPKVAPLSPERFAYQFTTSKTAHENVQYAQALLGHQIPSGDIAKVFELAIEALVRELEKRKFAATSRPRANTRRPSVRRSSHATRHIPAGVKRAVWMRDQGQCTFESDAGHRCPARSRLEFDHIEPVARGGQSTISGMRLRCRAHNQYEAERTFGTEFMEHKRQAARQATAESRARAAIARAQVPAVAADAPERDVTPWLRQLGFRADEARRAAAFCQTLPDTSLEERVRSALSFLSNPRQSH